MPHRRFNSDQAARHLHLTRAELDALVRAGEVPCEKIGDRVQFQPHELSAWASQRLLNMTPQRVREYHRETTVRQHDLSRDHRLMPELVAPEFVNAAFPAKTRAGVIRDLVAWANRTGKVVYPEDLRRGVEERERQCSTALGGGIAMLHPTHHEPYQFEDSFILLARATQPIPFGSPDGQTTDLFFLVCSQEERLHLHLLARLCAMCYHTDLILRLHEAADAATMRAALLAAEESVVRQA